MYSRLLLPDHEPVYLNKGSSRAELTLRKMEALLPIVSEKDRKRLEQDIALTKAGINGEQRIIYELENCHYPLVFIHDLQLEHEGMSAQVDFFVVTPYNVLVIECKNLYGNIRIDASGAFVRTVGRGRDRRQEGIYSPVTQNERHIELMKAICRDGANGLVRLLHRAFADDYYHSVVVLANERTVLDVKEAPEHVRRHVIRADQLIDHIKRLDKRYADKNGRDSFKWMMRRAERWMDRHAPVSVDLPGKYELDASRSQQPATAGSPESTITPAPKPVVLIPEGAAAPLCPRCGAPMVVRTARYGKRKGKAFWGCSNYRVTGCTGVINIDDQ